VKFEEIDESCYAFAPVQVLPELYIDLDMQLLTARDDQEEKLSRVVDGEWVCVRYRR
jgi:hypothetical protein